MVLNSRISYILIVGQYKILLTNIILKVETDIITSIVTSPTWRAAIIVIMPVTTFKRVLFYIHWCLTRFIYHMMFLSFNSNMTGATSWTGIAYSSGSPELTPCFNGVRVAPSLVFYIQKCTILVITVLLPLYCLSFDLRPLIATFGIFKPFYIIWMIELLNRQTI